MPDPQTSTTTIDKASRHTEIAALLAPYSPPKAEANLPREDEAS